MRTQTFKIKGTDKVIAEQYTRVVIGGQGPYIEFDPSHIILPLKTKPGQEYRGHGRYSDCKFFWLMPLGYPAVKIYHQRGTVDYADYKVGMMYIDPNLLDWEDDLYDLYAEQGSKPGEAQPTSYKRLVCTWCKASINGPHDVDERNKPICSACSKKADEDWDDYCKNFGAEAGFPDVEGN